MFERFHADARAVVTRGRDEAVAAGQDKIGSEHLLLGMLGGAQQPGSPGTGGPHGWGSASGPRAGAGPLVTAGSAAEALAAAGVSAAAIRSQLPRGTASPPDPLDAGALATLGIDLDAVRRASDASFGPGSLDRVSGIRPGRRGLLGRVAMTTEAKRTLELALRTAARRHDDHISSGHLLLGMIEQPGNPATAALREAGVDLASLRDDVLGRMAAAA